MNPDVEIFNATQQAMHAEQLANAAPEMSKEPSTTSTKTERSSSKDTLKEAPEKEPAFASYRFAMSTFTLYETKTRYYLVGTNQSKQKYRVLKIHRNNPRELNVIEDDVVYSEAEITRLLKMIEDGNLSVGGLHRVPMNIYGIVGFIRFTMGWYMIFITNRKQVALLGGHYIYHIDETRLVPIGSQVKIDKNSDEGRYITTFQNIDLTKNFYFSYTYDVTNTLQVNMTRPPIEKKDSPASKQSVPSGHNDMFVWNHYLLKSGFKDLNSRSGWILPIIYGFVDQAKISIFGRTVAVTLIARRSRHFAGARFLKRGVNDMGYVANDVETEQIVADLTTTSFHSTDKLFGNPRYTSYVQHRGSIPLIWSQDTTNMSPKPPIELNFIDPFYTAAAMHFENLFIRYGTPCIVLNLIKQKEKHKRESLLGKEFAQAISYLNQFLPEDKKIKYIAWDMSRASKSRDQDVINFLETISQEIIDSTGFFHSGPEPYSNVLRRNGGQDGERKMQSRQHGVLRTNCIDCLDRTNAAQFLMGKCALGHQLYALGVVSSPKIDFDSDVVKMFTEMYDDHGDTIALQYGGSHLVNTMETYRKINQWTSHPRDMIETIRRFYANAFSDADKQDAINLFLGNFVTEDGQPMLWELNSDYHLHNQDPRIQPTRRDYRKWFSPEAIAPKPEADSSIFDIPKDLHNTTANMDESDPYKGYWVEYYDPSSLTSFEQLFVHNMNVIPKYRSPRANIILPSGDRELTKEEVKELSPFTVRWPQVNRVIQTDAISKQPAEDMQNKRASRLQSRDYSPEWVTKQMIQRSLDPYVNQAEQREYYQYTHQFRAVENLVSTQDDDYTKGELPQEYQPYLQYVNRNSLDEHPSALRTRSRDEELYRIAVEVPQRLAEQQVTQEWTYNTKNSYEGYAAYTKSDTYWRSTTQHKQQDLLTLLQNNALGLSLSAATAAAAAVAGSTSKETVS